jgi:hypothetical protein
MRLLTSGFARVVVAAIVPLVAVTACSAPNVINTASTSPIPPIIMNIVGNKLPTIAEDAADAAVPGSGEIVKLGVSGIKDLAQELTKDKAQDTNSASMILIVEQSIDGTVKASIFKITTDHQLQVAMNGKFVEEIAPGEILIKVVPGTDSRIVITDPTASQIVYRSGRVELTGNSPIQFITGHHVYANLDTGQDNNVPAADAELDSSQNIVVTANGTEVAEWQGTGRPGLAICSSLPQQMWTTIMVDESQNNVGEIWCVRTSQGRYGTIEYTGFNIYWNFAYVLWRKPTDT